MKTLGLFFLANLGLYLPLQGQIAAFSENEAMEKSLSNPNSENLLGKGNGRSIEMLLNTSGMTITESYQSETQSTADTGARFVTDKNLSETLENDEALWSLTNKEDPAVRNRILAPLNIILAIMAALVMLGLTLFRMRSKRS